MPHSKLPKFVSWLGHGEVDFAAPLNATDDLLYAFALRSDRDSVQKFVDSTLGTVAKGVVKYRVLGDHVLLLYQHTGHFSSPINIGWAEDHETAIMVPLIQKLTRSPLSYKLCLWMPYLIIDVGLGMVTGRDVWGYNKSLGQSQIPKPTDPPVFNTQTLIFETFNPATAARVDTLISVSRDGGGTFGSTQSTWQDPESALRAIDKALSPWPARLRGSRDTLFNFLHLALGIDVPVINLKQMRDTEQTNLACYQSLVRAELQAKLREGGILKGKYTIKIQQCDSHQIANDFGLQNQGAKPGEYYSVPVKFAFWAKMDFNAPPGETVWEAN
jgi:hypothetical protein